MKHRVLHFLWAGRIGGAERAVYQLIRGQLLSGAYEVGVVFGQADGPYVDSIRALGAETLDLHMRGTGDLMHALKHVGEMRRFDIHHFHALEPAQIIASSLCKDATRVFTQRHGRHTVPEKLRKQLRRAFAGILLRRYVHGVAGNTQHASDYALSRYRLGNLPSLVAYNGIDFALLTQHSDRLTVRGDLGLNPGDFVIGSSGKFKSWKRFERVVDLLVQIPGAHVLLIGDGPTREALEQRAATAGVADRLIITGLVGQVADLLSALDVFVLPSTADESFGNAVVEAMGLGIPSIVFADSPGICEHIENGVTGFIVQNQDGLTQIVKRLLADSETRTRVGSAGMRHVQATYTLERMVQSYARLYDLALASRGTS